MCAPRKVILVLLLVGWSGSLLGQSLLSTEATDGGLVMETVVNGLDFPLGSTVLDDGTLLVTRTAGSGGFFGNPGEILWLDPESPSPVTVYSGFPKPPTDLQRAGQILALIGHGSTLDILSCTQAAPGTAPTVTLLRRIQIDFPLPNHQHTATGVALREVSGQFWTHEVLFQLGSEGNDYATQKTALVTSSGLFANLPVDSIARLRLNIKGTSVGVVGAGLVATGLRNPAGFAFHPLTGSLYFAENGMDVPTNRNEPLSADFVGFIDLDQPGFTAPDFGYPNNYVAYRTDTVVGRTDIDRYFLGQPFGNPFTGIESEGPNLVAFTPPCFPSGWNAGLVVTFHGRYSEGGLSNEENAVVFCDFVTGERRLLVPPQQVGLGHIIGVCSSSDTLYLIEWTSNGQVGSSGRGKGIIYAVKAAPGAIWSRLRELSRLQGESGALERHQIDER